MSESFLAKTESGDIYAWGWNEHGNLANGNIKDLLVATQIKAPSSGAIYTGGAFFFLRSPLN